MKKLIAFLICLSLVLALAGCVTAKPLQEDQLPGTTEAATAKTFTVTVVHADGSEKKFDYETTDKVLGDYLESQGLIESEGADDGMFHTVDGEKADWNENQSYWGFYIGEEYAMTGIYATDITDGSSYKLVYTIG